MRGSKLKIRVTDAWFDAAALLETPTTATTANTGSLRANTEKPESRKAQNATNAVSVSVNAEKVEIMDGTNPAFRSFHIPPSLFTRKGGAKEKGYIGIVEMWKDISRYACEGCLPLPYLEPDGALIIPFASPSPFHWWKPGALSIVEILDMMQAPPAAYRLHLTPAQFEAWATGGAA